MREVALFSVCKEIFYKWTTCPFSINLFETVQERGNDKAGNCFRFETVELPT